VKLVRGTRIKVLHDRNESPYYTMKVRFFASRLHAGLLLDYSGDFAPQAMANCCNQPPRSTQPSIPSGR